MSNVAFLSVPGRLRAYERLTEDVREITERRFQGYLRVIPQHGMAWWLMEVDTSGIEWPYGAWDSWWLGVASRRKLSAKHVNPDWLSWTQEVVLNELGVLYKGKMSDEGVNETWEPDAGKFPTFESYLTWRHEGLTRPTTISDRLDPRLRNL